VFQTTIDERTERQEMKTDEEPKKVSTSGPRSKKHGRKLEKKKAAKKAKQGKGLAIFSK
jgi:hypothetical protein